MVRSKSTMFRIAASMSTMSLAVMCLPARAARFLRELSFL